jgi:predicted Zn finger-like uncharacterized protein
MIVTCVSCNTRFRIPDDKVGPKGARVRCSRCQALFLVRRDDAPAGAASGPEPAPPDALPPPPQPAPARSAAGALEIELTSDPFALRSRAVGPAPVDPFALGGAETPAPSPAADPFAPVGAPDSFTTAALPFAPPPPGDPFAAAMPASFGGGIALEEGDRRRRTPMPGSLAALEQSDLPADFRTPGPSGLEVDDRRTEEQAVAAEPPPPPAESTPAPRPAAPPAGEATGTGATGTSTAGEPVRTRGSAVRRAFSVLVNSLSLALLLVLAGALYLYWTGGGKAALRAAVGRPPEGPFEAREVTSGLYDTAHGKPVLFIRGRVLSRHASPGPVRVRVELLDGKRRVAQGEGILGALPSPEEIWSASGPAEGERLQAAIRARAPARLDPGEVRPFLVVLWDYPADLRGLDLRVVAEPEPAG